MAFGVRTLRSATVKPNSDISDLTLATASDRSRSLVFAISSSSAARWAKRSLSDAICANPRKVWSSTDCERFDYRHSRQNESSTDYSPANISDEYCWNLSRHAVHRYWPAGIVWHRFFTHAQAADTLPRAGGKPERPA